VVRYGSSPGCAVRIAQVEALRGGLHLTLETPAGILELQSPLLGRVNAFNIAAAAATALALDVAPSAVSAGVAAMAQVPGRCQPVECGQPFLVVVDYAHSDDSLRNLLIGLRELTAKRLLVVFGCGGDRDRGKRPRMGAVAAELADLVFLTSDNPRSEDPRAILEEVLAGIPAARCTQCTVEPDRRSAIAQALAEASPGDVVAIAGKGHETVQLAGDRVIDFDDRVVADELLEELGWRG
jgi:UDP-N-acetylmuramoyl-L-alanyl-D-glutamate--2,6-diaminopimelate ligase